MKKNIVIAIVLCLSIITTAFAQNNSGKPRTDSSQELADKIVNSKVPVVIDFWAAWCMPCRFLDPIIEDLEKEYKGRALFMKVDIDVHKEISAYFRVDAVPMVYIVEDKTVRSVVRGVQGKAAYAKAIDDALKLAEERKTKTPPTTKEPAAEPCKNC